MEVQCPNCSSRFNLPDEVAKPGAKLRCSVCKEVFRLESPQSVDSMNLDRLHLDAKPKSRFKRVVLALVCIVLLGGGGAGGWWYWKSNLVKDKSQSTPPVSASEKVAKITFRNVRQYFEANERVGKIFVIEGKAVNEFSIPKEMIQVEATLYGPDKKVIASKAQLAGTVLSGFQLQVLGQKELDSFLGNKIEILTNNTNIAPGGEVDFMVLFYAPPEDIKEFTVDIIDVKDVPKKP